MKTPLIKAVAVVAGLSLAALSAFAQVSGEASRKSPVGAVYTMTNDAAGNAVVAFDRFQDGRLSFAAKVPTGGLGTGSGLGSQGSLTLSDDGRWLYAVNAGSDDVSVFKVLPDGINLVGRFSSGGDRPISVTQNGDTVYVLNAGAPNSIMGFHQGQSGALSPIPGSERMLSGVDVSPAQVSFSPSGDILVVTEKGTNALTSFTVDFLGRASLPIVTPSAGQTPFGFAWGKRDRLFVSEAFGGVTDASALSSYDTDSGAGVSNVSASVPTRQTAACWTVVTHNGKFAYTTNAGSSSVSGFAIARDGSVSLLSANGATGRTGANTAPVDAAVSMGDKFVYVLTGRTPTIAGFRIGDDGRLLNAGTTVLPAAHAGLAAR